MKRSCLGMVALTILLALAPAAEAQPPQGGGGRGGFGGFGFGGGPGGGGMGTTALIGLEQVQKELGLEGDSLTAVKEAVNGFRSDNLEVFRGLGNFREMSETEREAARQKMQEKVQALNKEHETILKELLSESQMARLQEIALQVRGIRALGDSEVAAKLGLTETQQAQIKEALQASDTAQRELFGQGGRPGGGQGGQDFAQMREKRDAIQKEAESKVMGVLTAEQKDKLASLKGKEFTLERGAFGGPGGPGGRPRGEGDGGGNRTRRPPTE